MPSRKRKRDVCAVGCNDRIRALEAGKGVTLRVAVSLRGGRAD
jgi:hypothetical protein